jgi:hypothetical protein
MNSSMASIEQAGIISATLIRGGIIPGGTWDLRRRTEITPVKDFHTRIKPLALASGHGRYITVIQRNTEYGMYRQVLSSNRSNPVDDII